MSRREVYQYIEDYKLVSIKRLCEIFNYSLKEMLELLKPLVISHKVSIEKDLIKYTPDSFDEEIPE